MEDDDDDDDNTDNNNNEKWEKFKTIIKGKNNT